MILKISLCINPPQTFKSQKRFVTHCQVHYPSSHKLRVIIHSIWKILAHCPSYFWSLNSPIYLSPSLNLIIPLPRDLTSQPNLHNDLRSLHPPIPSTEQQKKLPIFIKLLPFVNYLKGRGQEKERKDSCEEDSHRGGLVNRFLD